MSNLIKLEAYKALLDMEETEHGIKMIKEFFQMNLSTELKLRRVTAPLFVMKGLGINDDLNGVERPVSFPIKDMGDATAEVVHSLAKWKRMTLADYHVESYRKIKPFLPDSIHFIHSEDLLAMYPDKSAKEREDLICRKYGAVFIIGIGGELADGKPHDGRSPDYDDWTTESTPGHKGLNGDILIWYPVLGCAVELSSMGIRVDRDALLRQLRIAGKEEREKLYFHKCLIDGKLPQSIGGGIGQSRLCMVLLHKAHVGEIQASIWPDDMRRECEQMGMAII